MSEFKNQSKILKPKDRNEGYPKDFSPLLRKTLEILPGLFNWFMLLSPFIFTLLKIPEYLVYYVSFLTIFWAYRGIKFTIGIIIGYQRMKRDTQLNWKDKILNLIKENKETKKIYKNLKFVYIFPLVKEDLYVFEPSIKSLVESTIDSKKITLVFGLEETGAEKEKANIKEIKKKYGSKFNKILTYVHPKGIPGEVAGVKGANINWATRHFVKYLQEKKENIEDYLLITSDCDQRIHPKYLAAITYKYLTTKNRNKKYYSSALHTFNNNLWRVPTLIRIQSIMLTLGILHDWVFNKKNRETFSSYIVNLKIVDEVGYWAPDVGIDDTTFYWNALIRFDGDFYGEEVYIPTYNDAVENKNYIKTHKSLYKQQHRWGWGIIVFPTTIANLAKNKKISLIRKNEMIWVLLMGPHLLFFSAVYLITFALPILNILSVEYNYSSYSYNLPKIMSYILTALILLNIPIIIIRRKIMPPPKRWGIIRHILDIIETGTITITSLTFSFFPYIQAQTEMMLGKGMRKNYYATEKVKIGKEKNKSN